MQDVDVLSLARLLCYGGPDTRRGMAERLVQGGGGTAAWPLLAGTVRSREPWLLRARCLEMLGLAAARADRQTAELILRLVVAEGAPATQVRA
jgi:hypothetical protein